jgi:hypothetical protein
MSQQPRPLSNLPIVWEFKIAQQGFTARYGKSGGDLYRQYLPFGLEDPQAHPPKRIDQRLYDIARLKAKQTQPGTLP